MLGLNTIAEAGGKGMPPISGQNPRAVKGKSSFKRLSDVLPGSNGMGSKKDQWLVVFNDVILRCQRTGTTSLPLVSATNSRTNSLPELQGKAKYATTGRRNSQGKPRNLYKFLKVCATDDVIRLDSNDNPVDRNVEHRRCDTIWRRGRLERGVSARELCALV